MRAASFIRKALLMDRHVCPWWLAYTFDNPVRRLIHKPENIFGSCLSPGMTAVDIGCGMGYFSISMAHSVGDSGCVVSVDIQPRMLDIVARRAAKAGVADRIRLHRAVENSLGLTIQADFVLTFWMVHEAPDIQALMKQIYSLLKPTGKYLLAEPLFHVPAKRFNEIRCCALDSGFRITDEPRIFASRACVFGKDR